METCVRGFSFMPEAKVETGDLKYVESEDLQRAWKVTRRERLKKQEQKIWEEFIMEQDIVRSVSQDDPYQFLEQVSEECIKELLDLELQKMKQEVMEAQETKEEPTYNTTDNQHLVTFVENDDQECTMFQVFDDEKDEEVSGPEEEALNDSITSPPCTVRENLEVPSHSQSRPPSAEKVSYKSSSENVTNLIENSIYCAKVKELRMKINEELMNIINILENQNIANLDPCDVPKMMKHSAEFSSRFNRVHLYQLQRQMVDIERNSNMALPFAQRTHHQAQLVRITSLHNNILHAIQVVTKSFQQTPCIGESSSPLQGLVRALREARDCVSRVEACNVFDDAIEETCDKLEETINEYATKMSDYLNSIDSTSASSKKSSNTKSKDKSGVPKSGNQLFNNAESRLSMYSLEALRVTLNPKSSKCKDSSSSTSKGSNMKAKNTEKEDAAAQKKTPRKRRPLMRGPASVAPPRDCEQDVHTLVEVIACTSSHNDINKIPPTKSKITPRTPKSARKVIKTKSFANKNININKNIKEDLRTNEVSRMDSSRSNREVNKNMFEKETEDGVKNVSERDGDREKLDVKVQELSENVKEDRSKTPDAAPDSCEVTKVLRQLCGGDTRSRNEHVSGSRNAQLLCVQETSPRKPSTPQLLRILEETIQKKAPKPLFPKPIKVQDAEKYRMTLNITENVKNDLLQYRTKFVQHMLTSSMYANSAVGKPWEKIGSVSEKIIDELLLNCAKEMELDHFVTHLYTSETS